MKPNSSDIKGFAYCKELLQPFPLATTGPNMCYNLSRRVEHLHAFPPSPTTMKRLNNVLSTIKVIVTEDLPTLWDNILSSDTLRERWQDWLDSRN